MNHQNAKFANAENTLIDVELRTDISAPVLDEEQNVIPGQPVWGDWQITTIDQLYPQWAAISATATAFEAAVKLRRVEGSFREFMALFTMPEQVAMATAAMQNAMVKLWYDKAMGGSTLRLDHPDMIAGVAFMVSAGLLTQARADDVLDADFDA
jgi:hypothetical protein